MTKFNRIRNRTNGKTLLKAFGTTLEPTFDTKFNTGTCAKKSGDRTTAKRK